jgi:density-regulated protein
MTDIEEVAVLKPVEVIYCGKCGMPPEYCEYGPDFESHCNPWLKKNHPELHTKLKELRGVLPVVADATKEGGSDTVVVARPTAPWTTEERLTAFYQQYQPDKLSDVPSLLEKYSGKEDKLFLALVKKYGPEPDDPYFAGSSDDEDSDEGDDELEAGMENLNVDSKKRRGVKAKQSKIVETRVVVQKERSKGKKKTTVVLGMDTVPNLKLKDVAKDFSKRFAGSSSVKEGPSGDKQIIIQGDHMEDVADMIVKKFKVPGHCVFLDFDGDLVAFA